MHAPTDTAPRPHTPAAVFAAAVLLAACASGPPREAGPPPVLSPQLVSAGVLDLPRDCQPEPGKTRYAELWPRFVDRVV